MQFWQNRQRRHGFLLPAIAGILSAAGTIISNRQQRNMAREQMHFQERMSSTAAQRSVKDYAAAGLNPALAYERSASSPGGASATLGDAINAGVSSAQAAAALRSQLKLQESQTNAAQAQNYRDTQAGNLAAEQGKTEFTNRTFSIAQQPSDLRLRAATALLTENQAALARLQIPGAQNTADFERLLGMAKPGLASAKTLTEILKLFRR